MTNKKTILFSSIEQRLASMGYEWHSSEYFISPDEVYHPDPGKVLYRPNFYILGICVEGWIQYLVNGKLLTISSYCFFAAGPHNVIQRVEQSPDCKTRQIFFTKDFLLKNIIDVHQLESFNFLSSNTEAIVQLEKKDAKTLLQLYDILKNKRGNINSPIHLAIIRSLFFTFLYEGVTIYEKNSTITPPKFTRDAELNLKFKQLLAQHDKVQHNLKFYADSLFITPKYLIHAVKNASGKTPGKLIDEALLAEAKLLLKDFSHTIASVADELHFADQASFSRFFKKHTGLSPLFYRREG
jgi:AraC-like DNA-binding protein